MGCPFSVDINSAVGRKAGLSDEKLLAVVKDDLSVFSDIEKLVIELADEMANTPSNISDDLYTRLREKFSEEQLLQLGGQLAFLSATRTDADANVGYYGVMLEKRLGEAGKIKKPVMLHIAGKDAYQTPEARAEIMDGLKGNAHVTIHVYPEMDHAFARVGGQHYDKANADLANTRTDNFFRQHLG